MDREVLSGSNLSLVMTEVPGEVSISRVDPTERVADEKGGEESFLKSSVTEHPENPEEAVEHPTDKGSTANGSKQEERKSDVTVEEETDRVDSCSKENTGSSDAMGEERSEHSGAVENQPVEPSSATRTSAVDAHIAEPVNDEVSLSENKSEDDEPSTGTSAGAPSGTDEHKETDLASSLEKKDECDGLPVEEYTPISAETGEDGSKSKLVTDTAVEEKDVPVSEAEAEDAHITDPGAQEDNETTPEESTTVESKEPVTASATEEEEEETTPEESTTVESKEPSTTSGTEEEKEETTPEESTTVESKEPLAISGTEGEKEETTPEESTTVEIKEPLASPGTEGEKEGTPQESTTVESKEPLETFGTEDQKETTPEESTTVESKEPLAGTGTEGEKETIPEKAIIAERKEPLETFGTEGEKETTPEESTTVETFGLEGENETSPEESTTVESEEPLATSGTEEEKETTPEGSTTVESKEPLATSGAEDEKETTPEGSTTVESKESLVTTATEEEKETTPEGSTTVESNEPLATSATDYGIKQEASVADAGIVDNDSGIGDVAATSEDSFPKLEDEKDSETRVEESAQAAGSKEAVVGESTEAVEMTGSETEKEQLPTEPKSIEVQEKIIHEGDNEAPEESVEIVEDPGSATTLDEERKRSAGLLESVGDTVISLGSGVLGRAKELVGFGTSDTDTETGGEVERDLVESKSIDDKDVLVKGDGAQKDTDVSESVNKTETAERNYEEIEKGDKFEQPTLAHAQKELPPVDEGKTSVTVSDKAQDQLTTSAPEDSVDEEEEKKDEKELLTGDEVPVTVTVTDEAQDQISTSTPKDSVYQEEEKDNDDVAPVRSEVKPTASEPQEVTSSSWHNLSTVTEASEQSGTEEGAKERPLNVVVPVREAENKRAEESVSTPSTPLTPGGTPLIKRVEQLEKKLAEFEEKQNSPKSQKGSTGPSTPRSSVDRTSRLARQTLEETLSKGSLLDRVAALERKLGHILPVSGDPEVSPSTARSVKEELPVANQQGGAPQETVEASLKPLKLDFEVVPSPESKKEVQTVVSDLPVDAKTATNLEAMENLVQLNSKENTGAVVNLAQLNSAAEDSKSSKDVADVTSAKASEEVAKQKEDPKVPEDSKSAGTTAEVPAPVPIQTREVPPAVADKTKAQSEKSKGPVSKLKALFKGCIAGVK